jgi:hypothetical protein
VSDQSRVFQVVLLQEGFDVVGDRVVSVYFVMRRVAVVAGVDGIDGAVESAG